MKYKNRGFTLLELLICVSLISVVVVFLFRLINLVRNDEKLTGYIRANQANRNQIMDQVGSYISKYGVCDSVTNYADTDEVSGEELPKLELNLCNNKNLWLFVDEQNFTVKYGCTRNQYGVSDCETEDKYPMKDPDAWYDPLYYYNTGSFAGNVYNRIVFKTEKKGMASSSLDDIEIYWIDSNEVLGPDQYYYDKASAMYDARYHQGNILTDLSGNGKHASVNGGTWNEDYLSLNGTSDWVNAGIMNSGLITLDSTFSLSKTTGTQVIVGNIETGGASLHVSGGLISGQAYINGSYHYVQSRAPISINEKHNAAITYDGFNLRLYVDGALESTTSITGLISLPGNNTVMALGTNPVGSSSSGDFMSGKIYQASIYDTPLSPADVFELAKRQLGVRETSPVAKYDAKEHSGNTLTDLSGNNRNATINGGTFGDDYIALNGTSDWINAGVINSNYQSIEITFSASATNAVNLIGNWESGGGGIYLNGSNTIYGQLSINGVYQSVASTTQVVPGHKYNAVLTYDGNSLKIYVNGKLEGLTIASGVITPPQSNTVMGIATNPVGSSPGSGDFFAGNFYKASIYDYALSPIEVDSLAQESLGSTQLYPNFAFNMKNHNGNTLTDLGGSGRTANVSGATFGRNFLSFDGTNDWVNVGEFNPVHITIDSTFMLNPYPSNLSNYGQVIAGNMHGGGSGIYIGSDGHITGEVYVNGSYHFVSSDTLVETGVIYNVALTYDGVTEKLFVNGVLVDSANVIGKISAPLNHTVMALGANPNGNAPSDNQFLSGNIYSVSFYDEAVSDSEIIAMAEKELADVVLHPFAEYNAVNHSGSTLIDLVGNRNGTVTGGIWGSDYLQLNGTSDWVNIGEFNPAHITIDSTFMLNPSGISRSQVITGNMDGGGYGIYIDSAGHIKGEVYVNGSYRFVSSDTVIQTGVIYNVALTYDGVTEKLFVNGTLVDSLNIVGEITGPSNHTVTVLGANPTSNTAADEFLSGNIYTVSFYDEAVSDSEIIAMAEKELNGRAISLVAKYNAKNHSGYVLTDLSGHNKNATVSGGTWGTDYLLLNGTSDWINVGVMNSSYQTISLTFSPTSIRNETQWLMGNWEGGGGGLALLSNGKFYGDFSINGTDKTLTSANAVASPNNKYNLTVTYDGIKICLYVNGSLEASTNVSGTITAPKNNTVMAIGTNPNGNSNTLSAQLFGGKVYSASVYDRALSAAEVAELSREELS